MYFQIKYVYVKIKINLFNLFKTVFFNFSKLVIQDIWSIIILITFLYLVVV